MLFISLVIFKKGRPTTTLDVWAELIEDCPRIGDCALAGVSPAETLVDLEGWPPKFSTKNWDRECFSFWKASGWTTRMGE